MALACSLVVLGAIGLVGHERGWFTSAIAAGPLEQTPANGYIPSIRQGQTLTDAEQVLLLDGDAPAIVTDVTSVGGGKTLEYLGAMVAGPGRSQALSEDFHRYPPNDPAVQGSTTQAIGARILPKSQTADGVGYELLLGYRFISNQLAARKEIVVDYTVNGVSYRRVMPARILACPAAFSSAKCLRASNRLFPDG